jgi:hypothetical protein
MAAETLTLAESKLRLVMSFTAPPMLLALAILLFASDVAVWIPIVVGAVGALLTVFVLVDFATTIDIGPEGIVRHAPVRRAAIDWANVEKLVVPKRGGLAVVTIDGRHIILVDRKLVSHEVELAKAWARESGVGVETLTRKPRFGA